VGSSGAPSRYDEPYRMYNLDVFEYELDEPMALYGTIPLLVAHGLVEGKGRTTGMFWFNPSETFIDISDAGNPESKDTMHKESHWMSESGEIDFFLLPGPTPSAVYDQYTRLTGRQQLPPIFALGYHQCRWNYKDEKDVAAVESMFEKLDYPMDVMWLDIDHTEGNRYFTWDKSYFQTPIDMQKNLSNHGRKMVTIVDPHLKRDEGYYIHKEATAKGLYIKDKDGKDFDGWCWPGQSSYLDFTSPVVRQWWAEQFSLTKYIGSTLDLFTWNDMNEPSVFNGPEVSMNKHNLNIDGIEHREWHNLYGYYMQQATAEGLTLRSPPGNDPSLKLRPFVLTRSFWAGSQRWGAMWTGDNKAEWGHLKIAAPMLLSLNLAGLSFGGSDAGGFFGEPGAELFTRWYQAAAFTPFFRGHAHHDTKRREPWLFGEPYTSIVRTVTMVRYTLLPLWYTAFYHAYSTGQPVMRTMFSEFPDDRSTFTMDDQWLVGGSLLVKPVTDADVNAIDVYLPKSSDTDGWYDLNTLHYTPGAEEGQMVNIQAPLGSIPVFIRSGHIIPRKMRLRRSAKLMHFDPLTLVVAPSLGGSAKGALYMDDETSLAHETVGAFSYRQFRFEGNVLTCEAGVVLPSSPSSIAQATYRPPNTVERIEIAGQKSAPKRVVYRSLSKDNTQPGVELITFYDSASQMVVIKKPDGNVADDWSVTLEY
jgi:alpha 1,3-glucosidase